MPPGWRAGAPLSEQVAALEGECVTAARLIRALLRQVHSSDVFKLQDDGEVHNTPRETD